MLEIFTLIMALWGWIIVGFVLFYGKKNQKLIKRLYEKLGKSRDNLSMLQLHVSSLRPDAQKEMILKLKEYSRCIPFY